MATKEQLKTHITTAKEKLKKAGDPKSAEALKWRKKVKRLARKSAKITFAEKKAAEKKGKKKGEGEAAAPAAG